MELRAAAAPDVLRDLADPQAHGHRSGLLVADHLAGRLQLVVTSSMRQEVTRLTSQSERLLIEVIDSYPEVHADRAEVTSTRDRILKEVRSQHPGYPDTPQEHDALDHVAHAAAAGLNVFLTWDTDLIAMLGPAVARVTGMVLMSPDHAVVHLDELANAESFLKEEVEGGELDREHADSPLDAELAAFVARHAGERRDELEERVHRLRNAGHTVELLHLDDGTAVALYAVVPDGEVWRVPLLRLADHRLADTLARHLLWSLRRRARAAGVALLDVSEPYLSRRVVQAADFESMTHADGHWYAPVVDVCGSSRDVAAAAARSLSLAGLGAPPLLAPGVSAHAAARLEQAWWPAKIIDSELPCFVVPIRTAFAFELFGYPDGMTQRDTQLSLGREHVYYHSARNSVLTAPARILWLATGKGHGSGHFFGTSKLDGLMVDTPRRLYEALSYYGVFGLKAVIGAANGQPTAEALRLSNTEVFTHPVSVRRYEAMRSRLADGPSTFFSARRLNPRLFAEIYDTGTRSSANA
ncbi:hypothetical protein B0I31_10981 [Saccharothrix carnea]|uniref:Uncharacterized protein n=1 Tax=Saccharothrix carnea TaxID=1280637 RepID=A0A2P8I4A7_SACCR|nr:hypothetical protein [Saccharothrix carnea]PSL53291.1 hypothetical protein B0I31_10981 [Saccharothrix carnea]